MLGAEVSAHFDSMLVKLTCRGRDFPTAVRRARRAVAEFRIRGVSTNIPFLQAVLDDPDFQAGRITTSFIDERPQLLTARSSADRGTKILNYLADVTVNKPHGPRPSAVYPQDKLPTIDLSAPRRRGPSSGWSSWVPRVSRRGCATRKAVKLTDTTFRDAHQSLLATRIRTTGLLMVAPYIARLTPAVAVDGVLGRRDLRCGAAVPEGGSRGSGWPRCVRRCPTSACRCCCAAATPWATRRIRRPSPRRSWTRPRRTGIDIFRIFDALNNVDSMRPAIDAVRETGTARGRSRDVLHR